MEYIDLQHSQTTTVLENQTYRNASTGYIDNPLSTLENLFPSQTINSQVEKNRKKLGNLNEVLSDEQLQTMTSDFQFLIDAWLDQFEKDIFGGLTLQNLLKGK